MMFWVLAGALGLAVLAGLLLPQFRARQPAAGRSAYDVNVYKDQLAELERDLAEGRIAVSEADAARLEVQRRLLAAAEAGENEKAASSPAKGMKVIAAVALLVPLAAVGFYFKTGTPGMPDFPLAERTDIRKAPAQAAAGNGAGTAEGKSMRELAAQLEARLRENPDDISGWTLLARTYASFGDARQAAAAYQRAVELTNREPQLLADWAEARLMLREGSFTPEIFGDFLEAREKSPMLPKPWFYIGLDKAMGGDLRGAAQIWTDLLAFQPKDAPFVSAIRAQIARAAEEGGFDAAELKPSDVAQQLAEGMQASVPTEAPASGQQSAAPVPPGPSRADVEAAQQMSDEDRNAFIRSMVARLAEKLEENPNDPAGWERLIRAYGVLGETEKADAARARLKAIQGN